MNGSVVAGFVLFLEPQAVWDRAALYITKG
jgi:hypothetical protein